MNEKAAAKKAKYIASMIYLLIFTFIVGGTYINQQMTDQDKVVAQMSN